MLPLFLMTKKHESWKNESLRKNDFLHIAKRSRWHCFIIIVVVVAAVVVLTVDIFFFASVSNCLQRTCIVTYQFSLKTKQKPIPPLLEIDLKLAALIMGSSCCSITVWAGALLWFGTSSPRKDFCEGGI